MHASEGEGLPSDIRDRLAIADVLAAFCERVDEYDIPGLAEVFTEDCFTDYGPGRGGPVSGLAEVQARIARGQAEFRRTHHQLGQSRVTVDRRRRHRRHLRDGDPRAPGRRTVAGPPPLPGPAAADRCGLADRRAAGARRGRGGVAGHRLGVGAPGGAGAVTDPAAATRAAVRRFLAAVESGDSDAVAGCFSEGASYANVPHPPAVGRDAIRAVFARILPRCERIRWDLVSSAYDDGTAWLERVDRFWMDGRVYEIECNGVYTVDPQVGLITEVRDYVDLATWRDRLGDVLDHTR